MTITHQSVENHIQNEHVYPFVFLCLHCPTSPPPTFPVPPPTAIHHCQPFVLYPLNSEMGDT